ncbi:prephenate dehydrogenase [Polystyrenella longa]|uniref:Prephenate dehydrogenase n=1 Tax=Polystyrenella longa TaxID=2528007 RepID=A0A518CJM1_9PLAN|nr:prephenate dehydrogenase/arogenate dehydrogenase family protein [Polystyrenella longa]QDU79425.1 prephenate dehydrogenase [Polystyrenella longa]
MNSSAAENSLDFAQNITIQGVGLIGGSIAAALKILNFPGTIYGVGRNPERLQEAHDRGLIDEATTDIKEAAAKSDLIIVCTPVDQIVDNVREAADAAQPGTLITDGGSVKGSICGPLAEGLPDGVCFIGSHPLAGSEKQGFEHAQANLFDDRVCVVTPVENTPPDQLKRVIRLWEMLDMQVIEMDAETHDIALAQTSHLPHLVASVLCGGLADADRKLAATGFRDTTRIASGDPGLWQAIFLGNQEGLLRKLDDFQTLLQQYRTAIENQDAATLQNLLENAKRNRDGLSS